MYVWPTNKHMRRTTQV